MPGLPPSDADRRPAGRLARIVSFFLAAGLSVGLLVYPRALGAEPGGPEYGLLVLTMTGVCAGFAHGVGLVPGTRALRWLIGPPFAWPAMLGGAGLLLAG